MNNPSRRSARFVFSLVLGLLLITVGAPLRASIITIEFAGDGGTGIVEGGQGNFASISKTYDSVAPIDLILGVDEPGTYFIRESRVPGQGAGPLSAGILNNTGEAWTDFHLEISAYGEPVSGLEFTGVEQSTFAHVDNMGDTVWMDDGVVEDGGVFDLLIRFDVPAWPDNDLGLVEDLSLMQIKIRQTPTTAVPEPTTLLLLGIGLAGLGFARQRRLND